MKNKDEIEDKDEGKLSDVILMLSWAFVFAYMTAYLSGDIPYIFPFFPLLAIAIITFVYKVVIFEERTKLVSKYLSIIRNFISKDNLQETEDKKVDFKNPAPQQPPTNYPDFEKLQKEFQTQLSSFKADLNQNFSVQISDLKNEFNQTVEKLSKENQKLRKERDADIAKAINTYAQSIAKENKRKLLNDVFKDSETTYARSDEYEKQEFFDALKKKNENLEIQGIKQDFKEKSFLQDQRIFEIHQSTSNELTGLKSDMKDGFLHLKGEMLDIKGYMFTSFTEIESRFSNELLNVQQKLTTISSTMIEGFSKIKLEFGREILRLDQAQLKVIDRMKDYETLITKYGYEVQQTKVEAQRFALSGKEMLNRANLVADKHRVEIQKASNELQLGLQQVSFHKSDFANQVGKAKLMLDEVSNDQYHALKNMAYERIGINMLRQEHEQRVALEENKIIQLTKDQKHLQEKIQLELKNDRNVGHLEHRLQMTQENLSYANNRASLMRQEYSTMRKLVN